MGRLYGICLSIMSEQEQLNAILVAARLNGILLRVPKHKELYKGYVIIIADDDMGFCIINGKRANNYYMNVPALPRDELFARARAVIDKHRYSL